MAVIAVRPTLWMLQSGETGLWWGGGRGSDREQIRYLSSNGTLASIRSSRASSSLLIWHLRAAISGHLPRHADRQQEPLRMLLQCPPGVHPARSAGPVQISLPQSVNVPSRLAHRRGPIPI